MTANVDGVTRLRVPCAFPIVKKNDGKAHGEYRTNPIILEIYGAMADGARTGEPYQTRRDPPPADPPVAHPEGIRPAWQKTFVGHQPHLEVRAEEFFLDLLGASSR